MKTVLMAVALVGLMASGRAMALGLTSGTQFLAECQQAIRFVDNERKPSDNGVDTGHCLGVVKGVRATMSYFYSELPKAYKTCFPAGGISDVQGARIVVKYLRDNPEELHEEASLLTMLAFHKAFPCK